MAEPTIMSEVIAAALGGAISSGVLYPLEVLKTKMQAQQKQQQESDSDDSSSNNDNEEGNISQNTCQRQQLSMVEYAQCLYQREGLYVFLHGMGESVFQSAVEKSLYFFSYTILKQGVVRASLTSSSSKEQQQPKLGTLTSLVLGYISEWSHLPITLPLDCWTTAIQTSTFSSSTVSFARKGQGAFSILLQLLSEKGLKGMYKGIQAYQVLCLKPALQYTVFEQLKRILLLYQQQKSKSKSKKISLSAVEAFVLGMIARAVATMCVFPYLRAKVLMQVSASTGSASSSSPPRTGTSMTDSSIDSTKETERNTTSTNSIPNTIPGILQDLYQTGGVSELYRGVGPELTRGVLSAALMLMIKEQIARIVSNDMKNKKSSKAMSRETK